MTPATPTPDLQEVTGPVVHRFERAGLGAAPFKVVGYFVSKYQAVPGDPGCPIQPGSSCDYCGQGIMNVYRIRSADGKESKVGCDCVLGAGDTRMAKAVTTHRAKLATEARKDRERATILALKAALQTEPVRTRLAAEPHPLVWQARDGRTLLDWAEWMMSNAGAKGKMEVAKALTSRGVALSMILTFVR